MRGAVSNRLLAIGMARKGPLGVPENVRSYDQFVETFGEDFGYGELAIQMRQFFTAGGSDAVVVRAADATARSANLTVDSESANGVMTITAVDAGTLGDQIRAVFDYDTPDPELTFNMTIYRETVDAQGRLGRADEETYSNLTMDQAAPNFIENLVNGTSDLVTVTVHDDPAEPVAEDLGADNSMRIFSQSAIYFANDAAFQAAIEAIASPTIMVEVNGNRTVNVPLALGITNGDTPATLAGIAQQINTTMIAQSIPARVGVSLEGNGDGVALRIAVDPADDTTRSVRILPAVSHDATAALGLGATRGGVEIGFYSQFRPQMSGLSVSPFPASPAPATPDFVNILGLLTGAAGPYDVDFTDGTPNATVADLAFNIAGAANMLDDGDAGTPPSLADLQTYIDTLVAALNGEESLSELWRFSRMGLRIQGMRLDGAVGAATAAAFSNAAAGVAGYFAAVNAGRPSAALGQDGGLTGSDGNAPILGDYNTIFTTVERQVDIFNMLILPRCHNQSDAQRGFIWGRASGFCRDQNALLIVDPRSENNTWTTADDVVADNDDFKTGIVPEVSCTFWPRIRTSIGTNEVSVDPAGTVAGVMASTIARSGVWRAAAGLSAPLIGARGVEHPMSEAENGVINPRGINALRVKSTGAVVYGARTFAGDDNFSNRDFAYINVRMTTDFIKNSVSRALESFVFQNNNATTWANIELMVKSFMQGLYQKGAFRGTTADTAYDVQCNALTTSLADIQLGRLNVWVKFAPNFPAEFIHLHIQHMFQQPSA
ncbi:MAG: phage tail sheath C-terminal domain-containing protein [Pseudomonadota bacterium]